MPTFSGASLRLHCRETFGFPNPFPLPSFSSLLRLRREGGWDERLRFRCPLFLSFLPHITFLLYPVNLISSATNPTTAHSVLFTCSTRLLRPPHPRNNLTIQKTATPLFPHSVFHLCQPSHTPPCACPRLHQTTTTLRRFEDQDQG